MINKITFLISIITLLGCSESGKNKTYYKGREFVFQVDILKDSLLLKTHEIKLEVTDGLRAKIMTGGQTGIQYTYTDLIDSTTNKSLVEITGAIDKNNRVFIHPPRMAYMAFAEILPFPDINRKTEIGVNSEGVLSGIKGHGELDGKEIKQVDTIVAKKDVKLLGKKYNDVWIIHGENTNYLDELGRFKVIYWFDQNFGFIRMKYIKPNEEIVDLKLKEVKD